MLRSGKKTWHFVHVRAERIYRAMNPSRCDMCHQKQGELQAELAVEELRNTRKRHFKHFVIGRAVVPGAVEATAKGSIVRETAVERQREVILS